MVISDSELEACVGCDVILPKVAGPTHPYIGASASCWAMFSALFNAGEPAMAPSPANALLVDAYAVQHPGLPSPQAIQSVAVHLLTLYGVLDAGHAPDKAVWIRQQALRPGKSGKRDRFTWLTKPLCAETITVNDIVQAPTASLRTERAGQYINQVWSVWSQKHGPTIASWYEQFVI